MFKTGDKFLLPMSDGTMADWEIIDTMTETYVLASEYGSIIHLEFEMFENAVKSNTIKEVN